MSTIPHYALMLASGYAAGVAFRDRVFVRRPDGTFIDTAGQIELQQGEAELTTVRPLELVYGDALADLDDSLDPWDLRLQLRSLANATVTRQAERHAALAEHTPPLATPRCLDAPTNPWFEPTCPSDDRYLPILRAGYHGIWRGLGWRVRMIPNSTDCELIAYADPTAQVRAAGGLTEGREVQASSDPDAPYTLRVASTELDALYTVEGRALVDRHLVTIVATRPFVTFVTEQEVPEHERARQIAAAARFMRGEEDGEASPLELLGTDVAQPCSVAASRPLPPTREVDNARLRAIRMDRIDFVRTATGWQGDWRERRPPIYLRRVDSPTRD
ncbi:MAG: hypothetical protein Q4P36_01440 [Bowdeniella nasicola]|nr:hypothetical protein [Bowdeniella nasicola]